MSDVSKYAKDQILNRMASTLASWITPFFAI